MISMAKKLITVIPVIVVFIFILQFQDKNGNFESFAWGAATLSTDDCAKCHPTEPVTIEADGEKHATEVTCFDCHVGHPPIGEVVIPECSTCHEGTAHYSLDNCSECHSNTHAPLKIKTEGDITGPCLSCHVQQGEEMEAAPSAHKDQSCTSCHPAHKQIPECMECHEPHTEEQATNADCLSCHPAHTPLVITYEMNTSSKICASCHQTAYDELEANVTNHSDKTCAFCHRDRHRLIPTCQTCHAEPHPPAMHSKFPSCSECHNTAHNLDQVQPK